MTLLDAYFICASKPIASLLWRSVLSRYEQFTGEHMLAGEPASGAFADAGLERRVATQRPLVIDGGAKTRRRP